MEKVQKITYTFEEKYLKIDQEKRINRIQFIVRSIMGGIILGFVVGFIAGITQELMKGSPIGYQVLVGSIIGVIGGILYFYKVGVVLIRKRVHDFGVNPDKFILFYWIMLGSYYLVYFYDISLVVMGGRLFQPITLSTIIYHAISLFIGLYLAFRPGNKGPNKYGEDTSNVKLGFLG